MAAIAPSKVADTTKMSFAEVAAIAGKENVALPPKATAAASTSASSMPSLEITNAASQSAMLVPSTNISKISDQNPPSIQKNLPASAAAVTPGVQSSLVNAVKAMSVHDSKPSLVVNGSGVVGDDGRGTSADTSPDDQSQPTVDSGSEAGTKPPSLDGKSITSGTTFALDERESLRPDDSASVKAAEDDDAFSGRGSIIAGSKVGSEAAPRYRIYEPSDRRPTITGQEALLAGARTPHSGASSQQMLDQTRAQGSLEQIGEPAINPLFYKQTPDDKLLEALESPKDRLFLLRLEQQVMEFVKNSKEPFIDLPPCNSFCRMLTHKLADYYHLTHQVDAVASAVRIYRTPFCRIPQSLTSLSTPSTTANTPPPVMPAMKIMRRGEENGASIPNSKATSENSDDKDKATGVKEKAQLTREEREAQYALARERIFGKDSEKTGEATPDTEKSDNDMSRSSSVSNRDKSGKMGRRKRREDSESFDARSQYKVFYTTPQQQAWSPGPQMTNMNMVGPRNGGPTPNSYQNYSQMAPQYQVPVMEAGPMQYNQMGQSYQQQPMQQQNMLPQYQAAPMQNYGQQMPPAPQMQAAAWQQNIYPNQYQGQAPPPMQPHSRGPSSTGIPYAYGQLPSNVNPSDPRSQHPIPGSFNRSAFNPKTQSFVPGGRPAPQQMMPQHQQPMYQQQIYQQPMPPHGSPLPKFNGHGYSNSGQFSNGGNNMGYGMSRQSSNNSLPSYHASPHIPNRPMVQQNMPQNMPANLPPNPGFAQHPNGHSGNNGSHLPHYGNAATLPPKPPTAM